jgi:hypothetical protein
VTNLKKAARLLAEDAAGDVLFLLPNLMVADKGITGLPKNAIASPSTCPSWPRAEWRFAIPSGAFPHDDVVGSRPAGSAIRMALGDRGTPP